MEPEYQGLNYVSDNPAPAQPAKKNWKKKVIWLLVILVVIAVGYYGYKYYQARRMADPVYREAQTAKLIKGVTDKVGKLMILPKGETPTVATITDIDKLKADQPFYNDAQNGDQLLVYPSVRRAIIYSPSRNIIVNSGPVYVQDDQKPASEPVSTATSKPTAKKK